jgi:hypothetical protein
VIILNRLKAIVVLKDGYGTVANSPQQHIEFDDKCPVCGEGGLIVKENRYCADGEFYSTDNINCKNNCVFKYDDLINLTGFHRHS